MTDDMPRCAYHPDRETLVSCSRCERPVCPDCAIHAAVGIRCVGCLSEERREKPKVARELTAYSRSLRRPGWVFISLVALWLLLLVGLWRVAPTVASISDGGLSVPGYLKAMAVAAAIVGWIVSLCLHEWAHAYVAYKSGDHSVVGKGYLTLDPRKYTDPVLSFFLPMVFLILGGIGLPGGAVWIDHSRIRSRGQEAMISAAGPAVNIVFGIGCAWGAHLIGESALWVATSLAYLAWLQFLTAALNLLPVPGLDGYGIIDPYLPVEVRRSMWQAARYSLFLVFFVVAFTPVGQFIFEFANDAVRSFGSDVEGLYAIGREISRPSLK